MLCIESSLCFGEHGIGSSVSDQGIGAGFSHLLISSESLADFLLRNSREKKKLYIAHDQTGGRHLKSNKTDLGPHDFYSDLLRSFGSTNQQSSMTTKSPMQTGWSTNVPTACARRPVVNGAMAPPELPADEMKLIAVI